MSAASLALTIRCPHQTNDDLKIQAKSDWTVRQLKIYLHGSHPSKPAPERQRIVFAGQLLRDDARLSDYFKRYNANVDAGSNDIGGDRIPPPSYVLHLVYTESVESSMAAAEKRTNDETELRKRRTATTAASSSLANSAAAATTATAPPRQSAPSSSSTANTIGSSNSGVPYLAPTYWPWASAGVGTGTGMADPNDWVQQQQQMYTAMMTQWYGQYMQAMYGGPSAFYPFSPVVQPATGGVVHVAANGAGAGLHPQMEQQQPPVVPGGVLPQAARQPAMNAQGGLAPADVDDDDPRNRDWLDYVYMTCRASLLLMILYFYSSVERFVFVILCCTLLYGLQAGWFGRRAQQQQQQQQRPPQRAGAAAAGGDGGAPDAGAGADPPNEPAGGDVTAQARTPAEVPMTAWNVFWSTCWTFVSSFFASLVPERPPPLNV